MRHSEQPHLYIDTNVVIDGVLKRSSGQSSQVLLSRMADHGWRCTTSIYSFAEMLDALQRERRQLSDRRLTFRELNRIYDNLYGLVENDYSFVEFEAPTTPEFWDYLEAICGMTNLRAPDALHVATANSVLCDGVVTRDEEFLRIAREELPVRFPIPTVHPDYIDDGLVEIGFEIHATGQAIRRKPSSRSGVGSKGR